MRVRVRVKGEGEGEGWRSHTLTGGAACRSAKLLGASVPPQKGCSSSSSAKGTWLGLGVGLGLGLELQGKGHLRPGAGV